MNKLQSALIDIVTNIADKIVSFAEQNMKELPKDCFHSFRVTTNKDSRIIYQCKKCGITKRIGDC